MSQAAGSGVHSEHDDHPWTIHIGGHPDRSSSPSYLRSRGLMIKLAAQAQTLYGPGPYQDHHGGGLWVKDDAGWLLLQALAGIEWSAQFCADPAKVDVLRLTAHRVLDAFPKTLPGYAEFGYPDAEALLSTPIIDAATIAAWTDSIFNASVPLPQSLHTATLPGGSGYHYYPKPIIDIMLFKHDDFDLFVTDLTGQHVAVTPVSPRGSGDGRVVLAWAPPGSPTAQLQDTAEQRGQRAILPADHPLALQAFARQ
jgi:hypothetical protein